VLLVDTREPKPLLDIADTVLKLERPADGVAEGALRVQAKLLCARPHLAPQRFALCMTLRKEGAAWQHIDDIDHRAIVAYRLDRQDYSSREIARLLDVSPATAWRLVSRGERLPKPIRDRVELEVPIPKRKEKQSHLAKLLLNTLLPRENEGPAAQQRGDEGLRAEPDHDPSLQNNLSSSGLTRGPSSSGSTRNGVASGAGGAGSPDQVRGRHLEGKGEMDTVTAREPPAPQTHQPREAVKHLTRAERLWRTPLQVLMKERGLG
jgi:hypothetical protein